MSNTNSFVTIKDTDFRFPSLTSLRVVHSELLKRHRQQGNSSEFFDEVEDFIRQGRATGALLDSDEDRWACQSLLDYWATMLYSAEREPPEATLAEFDLTLAPELSDDQCPYLGLDAFQETERSLFFGRQRLIDKLIDQLKENRLLAVVGPSGSGKSSLVLAGLLPTLRNDGLPDSQKWHYYPAIVPGSHPLVNLAHLFQPADVAGVEWVRVQIDYFQHDSAHLAKLINRAHKAVPAVIIIDQFEEVFTLCRDDDRRQAFVNNLVSLTAEPGARHIVILTMRTDFETQVARLPNLLPLFEQSQIRVTPLSAGELRDAIEKPAELIGLKFEEGVVERLIEELLGEPAGLPLLQFTLLKLWENRERNRVTWDAYRRIGGGREALARSADEFYNGLIPEEQITARRMLLRLVRPSEGMEITSNRIRRETLYQAGEARDRIDRVLERLIRARLVRLTEDDSPTDAQVEVAHEALVRNWPKLVDWLEDERENIRQRLRLTAIAEQWEAIGKDPSALLGGPLLEQALRYEDLNELETEFVEASQAAIEEAERAQEAARLEELVQVRAFLVEEHEREIRLERQRAEEQAGAARRMRRLIVALAVFFLLAVGAVTLAIDRTKQAELQTRLANSHRLATQALLYLDNQFDLALLLSLEAIRMSDTLEARKSLLAILGPDPYLKTLLKGHTGSVRSVAFSSDGQVLASGSWDGTIILWDVATAEPLGSPLTGHSDRVNSVAFSPVAQMLASGGRNQSIILWDVDQREPVGQPLEGHKNTVTSIVFSPNGQTLASGSEDGTIILWDVDTQQALGRPLAGHSNTVTSVGFSPNGQTLASGSYDNTVILWDVATHQLLGQPLSGHNDWVFSVAFSPDGQTLASGGADGTIVLWDVDTHQSLPPSLAGHTNWVLSVAFSPDGQTLTSTGRNRNIILWDVATHQPLGQPLSGHNDWVFSVAFSPDGQKMTTGGDDQAVILWDISPASWQAHACSMANRNLTEAEWQQFVGSNVPYERTCPNLP